jgi:integrase
VRGEPTLKNAHDPFARARGRTGHGPDLSRPIHKIRLCPAAEQTGMRVGELSKLEWQDVDAAGSRFRIRGGKTAAARRWVGVPEWLMDEVLGTCPPDDRLPERRVFQDRPGRCSPRRCGADAKRPASPFTRRTISATATRA